MTPLHEKHPEVKKTKLDLLLFGSIGDSPEIFDANGFKRIQASKSLKE